MAMLKTLVRKNGGCAQIKSYLERDGRAVTLDCSPDVDPKRWDESFDLVRAAWGKDAGRKYYHFIISPDPKDGINVQTVRELAYAWVEKRYPDSQWVIETHIDNGIPHAHIVMNSVYPTTGKKIQISDGDIRRDACEVQRLCKERGMSAFDNYRIVRDGDGEWIAKSAIPMRDGECSRRKPREAQRSRSRKQEWMRKKGIHLWTDDMREAVERALSGCGTWGAFERALASAGYAINVNRRGVLTFYPPEGAGYAIKGYKLDDSYTVEGIRRRLAPQLDGRARSGVIGNPPPTLRLPQTFSEALSVRMERMPRKSKADVARLQAYMDAVALIKKNGYTSTAQLAQAARELRAQAEGLAKRLDDARLAYEQMDAASKYLIEREALSGRMGKRPANPVSERRWRKDNAEELDRMAFIDKWLAERGLGAHTALPDIQKERGRLCGEVAELANRADGLADAAARTEAAAQAVSGLALASSEPSSARVREGKAAHAPRLSTVLSAEEFARIMREELKRNKRRAAVLLSAQAQSREIALLMDADGADIAVLPDDARPSREPDYERERREAQNRQHQSEIADAAALKRGAFGQARGTRI